MLHEWRSATAGDSRPILWALDGLPSDSAVKLEAWLDSLSELSLADWARVGRACASRGELAALASACRAVERVIDAKNLDVAAWLIRDLVETATYHVRHFASRSSRRARSELAVARMAAEWVALGISVEAWLAPSELTTLVKPFARETQPTLQFSTTGSGRASSSVAMPGTRSEKTLPPPSRSRNITSPP